MKQLKSWRFNGDTGPYPRRVKLITNQDYFFPLENHVYSLTFENIKRIVENALNEVGWDYNGIGTCFSSDLDPNDKPLPLGYLEIYNTHIKEDIVVEIMTYYQVLLDTCFQLKLVNKGELESTDLANINMAIQSLEKHVNASVLDFGFPSNWQIQYNERSKLFDDDERKFLDQSFNFNLRDDLSIQLRHYDFIGLEELTDHLDPGQFRQVVESGNFRHNKPFKSYKGKDDHYVYYYHYQYTVEEQYLIIVTHGEKQPTRFQLYLESIWRSI